jgi:hypothetical protein
MRKLYYMMVFMLIVLLFCACPKHENKTVYEIAAIRSNTPISVDGLLDEPVWQEAGKIHLKDSDTGEDVQDTLFSAYALICYDHDYLYVAFVCRDRDVYSSYTRRDQHLWEEEAVEVFIDVDDEPSTYVEIELSPNNVIYDSFIVDTLNIDIEVTSEFDLAGIKTAVAVDGTVNIRDDVDRRWIAEMAVPFTGILEAFRPELSKDTEFRINLFRIDRDEDGPIHYAWSPTYGPFHKPAAFGKLNFQ